MVARADRSLLPGAPHPDAARKSTGLFAIDLAMSRAFSLDPQVIVDCGDPDKCDASFLPFLAWAVSVDEWPAGITESEKRAIIKASVSVHLHKGTKKAIRDVLAACGYGTATITTGENLKRYSGAVSYDGSITYGPEWNWALWSVILENSDPLPSPELISLLIQTAPARCVLLGVGYEKLFFRYNSAFAHDGSRKYQRTYMEVA